MATREAGVRLDRRRRADLKRTTGIAVLLSVAVAWFYVQVVGTGGWLTAHNAIYHYSGLRLLDGVPPYVSMFDMKTPLATFVSAGAIALGRLLGLSGLEATRVVFAVLAASGSVPIYLAARQLFDSDLAGLFGVLSLMTVTPWLWDISAGPRPKVLAGALVAWAVWSTIDRRWFIGALLFGFAGLCWQPAILGIGGLLAGAISDRENRWWNLGEVAAGAVTPFLAASVYFLAADAFSVFLDGALRVHLNYVSSRAVMNPLAGLTLLTVYLQDTRLWVGVVAGLMVFNAAAMFAGTLDKWRPSRIAVVTACGLYLVWSLVDIQSPADMYVLLPFAAVGLGGLTAILVTYCEEQWSVASRVAVPVIAALFMLSAGVSGFRVNIQTGQDTPTSLESQKGTVAEILAITGGDPATVIGATEILSLTGWSSPTRHVVINSGVDRYIDDHHRGGFRAWMADVLCGDRRYLVLGRTVGDLMDRFRSEVAEHYRLRREFSDWQLFYPAWIQTFRLSRHDLAVWVRETSASECRAELAAGPGEADKESTSLTSGPARGLVPRTR